MPDAPTIRIATSADVPAMCAFGARVVPAHYAPLVGHEAAQAQVDDWWTPAAFARPVADGRVLVAERDGEVVAVAQRGPGPDHAHVLHKLYLAPDARGSGLGPRLVDALIATLPAGTAEFWVEHFQGNPRAAAFYEREGFALDRVAPTASGDPRRAQVWRRRTLPR